VLVRRPVGGEQQQGSSARIVESNIRIANWLTAPRVRTDIFMILVNFLESLHKL